MQQQHANNNNKGVLHSAHILYTQLFKITPTTITLTHTRTYKHIYNLNKNRLIWLPICLSTAAPHMVLCNAALQMMGLTQFGKSEHICQNQDFLVWSILKLGFQRFRENGEKGKVEGSKGGPGEGETFHTHTWFKAAKLALPPAGNKYRGRAHGWGSELLVRAETAEWCRGRPKPGWRRGDHILAAVPVHPTMTKKSRSLSMVQVKVTRISIMQKEDLLLRSLRSWNTCPFYIIRTTDLIPKQQITC